MWLKVSDGNATSKFSASRHWVWVVAKKSQTKHPASGDSFRNFYINIYIYDLIPTLGMRMSCVQQNGTSDREHRWQADTWAPQFSKPFGDIHILTPFARIWWNLSAGSAGPVKAKGMSFPSNEWMFTKTTKVSMHQNKWKAWVLFQLRVLCLELGLCAVNWGGVGLCHL